MSLGSVLKEVKKWWDGSTDEVAEAMKDPLRDHKLAIKQGEQKLEEFRTKIAGLMASQTALGRKLVTKKAEVAKYDEIAKQAAAAGNVDDVKAAVELKQKFENEVGALQAQLALGEEQLTQLRATLEEGERKVEAAKEELVGLSARLEGAKIRKDLAQAQSEFLGGGGVSSLDDLRKLVEQEEDVASAKTELTGAHGAEKTLAEKYAPGKEAVDDAVASYMEAATKKKK